MTIADFDGFIPAMLVYRGATIADFYAFLPSMLVYRGATVTLTECSFSEYSYALSNDNSLFNDSELELDYMLQTQDTIIRFKRCEFPDNMYAAQLVTDLRSGYHPDGAVLVISEPYNDGLEVNHIEVIESANDVAFGNETVISTINAATVPAERKGINSKSSWFQGVQKVRCHFASRLTTSSEVAEMHPPRHYWRLTL
jgi:hypothetical protein